MLSKGRMNYHLSPFERGSSAGLAVFGKLSAQA